MIILQVEGTRYQIRRLDVWNIGLEEERIRTKKKTGEKETYWYTFGYYSTVAGACYGLLQELVSSHIDTDINQSLQECIDFEKQCIEKIENMCKNIDIPEEE